MIQIPNTKEILAGLGVAYLFLKHWWNDIEPTIKPILEEVEQMALDGKIDIADRKKIAMDTIDALQQTDKIHLNFFEKLVIGKIVDVIAQRLPDFQVSQSVKNIIANLPK